MSCPECEQQADSYEALLESAHEDLESTEAELNRLEEVHGELERDHERVCDEFADMEESHNELSGQLIAARGFLRLILQRAEGYEDPRHVLGDLAEDVASFAADGLRESGEGES